MQPMRSGLMEWRGPPFFLVGGEREGEGVFFFKLCLVWRLDSSLFTFHLDSQHSMHAFFFSFPLSRFWRVGRGEIDSKQWVPKFLTCCPQRVPNSTSLLSHMLWQMLSSFHLYSWAKGKELYSLKKKPSILGSLHNIYFFLSDEPIKLAYCKPKKKKNLKLVATSSN